MVVARGTVCFVVELTFSQKLLADPSIGEAGGAAAAGETESNAPFHSATGLPRSSHILDA